MEQIISLLEILNTMSPLAIIALLVGIIGFITWKNPLKPITSSLHEVKTNHLHELPEMNENIKKAVEVLQRIEVKISEDFSYIKAKIDTLPKG